MPFPRLLPCRYALSVLVACVGMLVVPTSAHAMLAGMQSDIQTIYASPQVATKNFNRMKAIGVQLVRVNVSWADISRNCGGRAHLHRHTNPCYSWEQLDRTVRLAQQRRIRLLVSVSRVPYWANRSMDRYYVGNTDRHFTRIVGHYSNFVYAMGVRYGTRSRIGRIQYWTIWNEPNSANFWKPFDATDSPRMSAPRRYAYMYARSATRLRNVFPGALVAPGPTGPCSTWRPLSYIPNAQRWLNYYLNVYNGRRSSRYYLNAWAHNPYPGSRSSPRTAFMRWPCAGMGNLGDLFRTMDAHSLTRGVRFWATEFAYESNPPERRYGVSLYNHASWLAESYDLLWTSRRFTIATWYALKDRRRLNDWQSGLYFHGGSAKPSLRMFMRPISRSRAAIRRGQSVRIWGRSHVSPSTGVIQWSIYNLRTRRWGPWVNMPAQSARTRYGARTRVFAPQASIRVRVADAKGVAPPQAWRQVTVIR